MQIQFIHTWYRRKKNTGNPVKFKRPCFHRLKICEPSRHDRGECRAGRGKGRLSTIVGIANVWHKRLVKTSWETPRARGFRTPGGRRQPEEGGASDEGNEARNRISRSSASRQSSFRRRASPGSHSREVEREIMHWTAPPVRRTEKCHWLPEFRVGTTTRSAEGDEEPSCSRITRRREHGRKSRRRGDQLSKLNKN